LRSEVEEGEEVGRGDVSTGGLRIRLVRLERAWSPLLMSVSLQPAYERVS
jgi:hypothetical protein